MGNCLSPGRKSSMNHNSSITSSDKAAADESTKSPVKDGFKGSKDTVILDSQPKLSSDSDSEGYFSAADDETQLYDRTSINPIDHPESSSASCKEKLEINEMKKKLLFELFNESSMVKEAQGRGVAVDLPADSSVKTKKKRSPAGKERALAATHFRLPRLS